MESEVKALIVSWEKLRIVFNLLIGGYGLFLSWWIHDEMGGWMIYAFFAFLYGVAANVFFSIGPLAEIYLKIFTTASPEKFRIPVFIAGTMFSLLVTSFAYGAAILGFCSGEIFD